MFVRFVALLVGVVLLATSCSSAPLATPETAAPEVAESEDTQPEVAESEVTEPQSSAAQSDPTPATSSGPGLDGTAVTVYASPGDDDRSGATFIGLDESGEATWTLEVDSRRNGDPFLRDLGDGELMTFVGGELTRIDMQGNTLQRYDLSKVPGAHHDAVLLDDGGVLGLGREVRTIDGEQVAGDVIVELDANGNAVWQWSTFDHLDTARFPSELSTRGLRAADGALDWTHGNAISFDAARNQVLLSLRSQSWIVNIDRATGDIVWIAGDDAGIAADFDAPFLSLESGTWQTAQHAATWTAAGELLIYDNRNESGGTANNSRAVIYSIDDDSLQADQLFEFVMPRYTSNAGDVDELDNGNILINAGGRGVGNSAAFVEVDRQGNVVWQATVQGQVYRIERIVVPDAGASTTSEPEAATGQTGSQTGTVDLTGVTLTSTSASCASYVGDYSSTVTDASNGNDFTGAVSIRETGDSCVIESNQIPNHEISSGAQFPNETGEVAGVFEIPASPERNSAPTPLGFNTHAVMLNGVIWEAYPAACFDEGPSPTGREAIGCGGNLRDHPWRYNVGSPLNVFRLDAYSAHAQATGLYHYHATPQALYDIECSGEAASPVIGFARDGFPLYGPCFVDATGAIRAAESSFDLRAGDRQDVDGYTTPFVTGNVATTTYNGQFIGDYEYVPGSGDLDECNGMTVDGRYGYFVTGEFPYVVSCFSGTPSTTFGR